MIRAPNRHYWIAASIVMLVALAKAPIEAVIGPGPPLILFVPAVTLAAWLGGMGPGLLATALSTLTCCYFFLSPIGSMRVQNSNDLFRLTVFWVQGVMTCVLIERLRAAQRQTEEGLRRVEDYRDQVLRNEGMLRALLDCSTAIISIKDAEGRYILANRLYEVSFGGLGRPIVGSTDLEVFPREFAEKFRSDDRQVFETGRSLECEETAMMGDGLHVFSTVKFPLRGPDGTCYAVGGFSTDITARKRAESERDRLLNLSPELLCIADRNGLFKQLNPAWTRILGWGIDELIGQPLLEFVHPDDRDRTAEAGVLAEAGNPLLELENRYRCSDGSYRWISWTAFSPLEGEVAFALGRDVTEQRHAEALLRDSEAAQRRAAEALTATMNALPAHIALLDSQGFIVAVNESWRRFASANALRSEDFSVGQNYLRVCESATGENCSEDAEEILVGLRGVLEGTRPDFTIEYPCHSPGQVLWYRMMATPLHENHREGAVVMHINITDRKLAELAMRNYATRLENLRAIDRAILMSIGTSEIAGSALNQLGRLVPSWAGCMLTYDFDRNEAEIIACLDSMEGLYPQGSRFQLHPGTHRDIATLRSGQVISIGDTRESDYQGRPIIQRFVEIGLRSYVFVPMIERGELVGTVCLGSNDPGAFDSNHIDMCREMADQLAIAIREATLFEELRSSKDRLESLSRQLLRAEEEERRRIARELHDEIGQAMTALKINLQEAIDGGENVQARLDDSLAIVDLSLDQVRSMALDLRPSILDDFGLVAALEWYVGRHAQRTGLQGRVVADPPDIHADPEIETVCFRITQEALTNMARHAQATRFSVELTQHYGGLELVIRDDGRGFDPAEALRSASMGTSLGLAGMRERVELVGGRIAFVSEPGGGTEVQANLPSSPRPLRAGDQSGGAR